MCGIWNGWYTSNKRNDSVSPGFPGGVGKVQQRMEDEDEVYEPIPN